MNKPKRYFFDVLIIGGGIAGLSAAITAAERGKRVAVISKESALVESNTRWAQGGVVGKSDEDNESLLESDIVEAGARVNSTAAVRQLVREGPALTESFLKEKIGVPFTLGEDGTPALTMEAAHSVRRILYSKDKTGEAIQTTLVRYVESISSITVFTDHTAIDLITNVHNSTDPQEKYRTTRVIGTYALNAASTDSGGSATTAHATAHATASATASATVHAFFAPVVLLATGGVGNLFRHTSNPVGATGDGIAMAYRLGAEVINAEYVQFHPTILFHRDVKRFLISESVRGEGARLVNRANERFMERYHPEQADLAPRDEVARAIYREMEREDSEYVRLDATNITEFPVEERFPGIFEQCNALGMDMRQEAIPVVPGAHYFCGGVKVDLNGRTSVDGLLAAGEVACTGVHGANRLASISLLEGLVWGVHAGEIASESPPLDKELANSVHDWQVPASVEEFDPVLVNQDFRTIQSTMWNYAGIIRSRKRLLRAFADLDYLSHRVEQFYREARLDRHILELRNSVLTASIIVRAALANTHSTGCHFIEDDV